MNADQVEVGDMVITRTGPDRVVKVESDPPHGVWIYLRDSVNFWPPDAEVEVQ